MVPLAGGERWDVDSERTLMYGAVRIAVVREHIDLHLLPGARAGAGAGGVVLCHGRTVCCDGDRDRTCIRSAMLIVERELESVDAEELRIGCVGETQPAIDHGGSVRRVLEKGNDDVIALRVGWADARRLQS